MKNIFLSLLISSNILLADYSRDETSSIVIDNASSLEWQDDLITDKMRWNQAVGYCKSLELGSYSDWRLPSKQELDGLIDKKRNVPSISEEFQNTISYRYWTSTTNTTSRRDTSRAWYVNFSYGHKDSFSKEDIYHVRCVRG